MQAAIHYSVSHPSAFVSHLPSVSSRSFCTLLFYNVHQHVLLDMGACVLMHRPCGGGGDPGGQLVAGGRPGPALCGASQPPWLEGTLPFCARG